MFGSLGGGEIVVILVLALLLFGPRKLPEIGRTLGKAVNQFRGASNEFRRSLEREVHLSDLKETADGLKGAADEIRSDLRSVAQGSIDGPERRPRTDRRIEAEPFATAEGSRAPRCSQNRILKWRCPCSNTSTNFGRGCSAWWWPT